MGQPGAQAPAQNPIFGQDWMAMSEAQKVLNHYNQNPVQLANLSNADPEMATAINDAQSGNMQKLIALVKGRLARVQARRLEQ